MEHSDRKWIPNCDQVKQAYILIATIRQTITPKSRAALSLTINPPFAGDKFLPRSEILSFSYFLSTPISVTVTFPRTAAVKKMKGMTPLRRRLRLIFLVPIVFGSVVIACVALAPIFLKYQCWVDHTASEIVNSQSTYLLQLSAQVATLNTAFLQTPLNLALIISRLTQNYYDGLLAVKSHFLSDRSLEEKTYRNAVELYLENCTALDYSHSMWYVSPDITEVSELDDVDADHLIDCSVFDSFIRPTVSSTEGDRTLEIFMAYADTGFFYSTPAAGYAFMRNYTGPTCEYNADDPSSFDARCRPWFQSVKDATFRYYPTISDPFVVLFDRHIGQNVCTGVWDGNKLIMAMSLDFTVQHLEEDIAQLAQVKGGYAFALNSDGSVFMHPKFNRFAASVPSIFDLEFGSNNTEEAKAFRSHIVPLLLSGKPALEKYQKDGETMLIAIQPVYTNMGVSDLYRRQLSSAVIMPQHVLWEDVESLRSQSAHILIMEVIILSIFLVGLLVMGWL